MMHKVELRPFTIPNFVIQVVPARPRQEGFSEAPKYHLSELSNETLSSMCNEFRDGVFAKAKQGT